MSAFASIIRFDGGEVEPGAIATMTAAMAFAGPDGITHRQDGAIALGHCMLHTTAEALEERQPLANEDDSLVLVFDGWLENPAELREELLRRGAKLRDRSDAELLLRAWECWGEDCPIRLHGEFAFLVWDRRRQTAFCVRDHAGLRPLYYHWDGARLIVASYHFAILAVPGVPQRLNLGAVAEILSNDSVTRGETMWEGIARLDPAGMLRCDRAGPVLRTWWEPPLEITLRYRRDEDYREHYLALLTDCVRAAARSHRPVASDVSGGLDSSALFALAHDLARKGELPAPGVRGYCFRFEDGTPAGELAYSRSVARHVGAEVREIDPFFPDFDWFRARGQANRDMVPYPNATMSNAVGDALLADGCRVSLSGEGGDEWLGGKPLYYTEQLAAGQFGTLLRTLGEDRADLGLAATAGRFATGGLLPLAPLWLRRLRRRLRPPAVRDAYWLGPELAGLLAQRRQAADRVNGFDGIRNPARRGMYMTLKDIWNEITRDVQHLQVARQGYEVRTPMYSRRFVEFAFATPERLRLRGNLRKSLHRQAMAGLLPEDVLRRETKAEFSIAFERHIDEFKNCRANSLPFTGQGFLDPAGLARLLQEYREKPLYSRPVWEIWAVMACELLLCAERERRLGLDGAKG